MVIEVRHVIARLGRAIQTHQLYDGDSQHIQARYRGSYGQAME